MPSHCYIFLKTTSLPRFVFASSQAVACSLKLHLYRDLFLRLHKLSLVLLVAVFLPPRQVNPPPRQVIPPWRLNPPRRLNFVIVHIFNHLRDTDKRIFVGITSNLSVAAKTTHFFLYLSADKYATSASEDKYFLESRPNLRKKSIISLS